MKRFLLLLTAVCLLSTALFSQSRSGIFTNLMTTRSDGSTVTLAAQSGAVYVVTSATSGANLGAKLATAIAAVTTASPTGGVIDARSLFGAQSLGGDLTISQPNLTILLGPITLSMGTHRIIVSAGTNGVSIEGVGAWGSTGSAQRNSGTQLNYTGTGSAIVVGSSSATTYMTHLKDLSILVTGNGAVGIALNRTQHAVLERMRVGGPSTGSTANTQTLIKSDGTGGFSAFTQIRSCWLSNGLIGIQFTGAGSDNNSNQILGGNYSGSTSRGVSGAIGVSIVGGETNYIAGFDIENTETGIQLTRNALRNYVAMVRFETATIATHISVASGSNNNYFASPMSSLTISDSGRDNTFIRPDKYSVSSAGALTLGTPLTPANGGVAHVNTVGQGWFLGGFVYYLNGSISAAAINSSNNQVRAIQFVLPFAETVGKITYEIAAGQAGATCDLGLYDAAGTTKLVSTGGFSATSNDHGIHTVTVTPVLLTAGTYWFAATCSDATVTFRRFDSNSSLHPILNHSVKRSGVTTNSASSGVLPPSLGSPVIATSAGFNMPVTVFER